METTNIWITAFEAIKRTPVGEAGQYLSTPFFRDDRRHITILRDGRQERFDNDYGAAELVRISPPPLPTGTPVHVRSEHFVEECDGIIADADYDDGWLYRIEATAGDRIDGQRNEKGELWVCDFEIVPLDAREA